jgi:predicted small metal-binding protein
MLYRYSCKDMGLNCPFVIKGESQEEVTEKALVHIQENHSNEFNNLLSPEQIDSMRRALARSTKVVPG